MKVIATIVFLVLIACSPSINKAISKIEMAEKVYKSSHYFITDKTTVKLLKSYQKFVKKFPEDERSAIFLYKSALVYVEFEHYEDAIPLFAQINKEYPNYEKAAYCMYVQAFYYENKLKNLEKAKEIYQSFLEKYPNHPLAQDAKYSLNNLGK